ncbi:MAG: holo-ACP synthase [Faecalibacterium sp.]
MLYGIGCDLCEIARMEQALRGAHGAAFARRVFGPAECAALSLNAPLPEGRSGAHRAASAAADFAAKEAFLKAAGTGLRAPFSLCEIETVRLPSGQPEYRFSGQSAAWMAERGLTARLSLSHDGGFALAFCILESNGTLAHTME